MNLILSKTFVLFYSFLKSFLILLLIFCGFLCLFFWTVVLSLVLVVLLIGLSDAAPNKRRRNRNKKDQCHLREAENCINQIQKLGKGKDPTSIIATAKGLDRICKFVAIPLFCYFPLAYDSE